MQRQSAELSEEEKEKGEIDGTGAESQINAIREDGLPQPASVRPFFEPRFGHDFSKVRVHHDAQAAESARSINARAYTVGRNIVFGRGQYAPATTSGQLLLAHELTHVVQQSHNGMLSIQRWIAPTDWLDYIGLAIDIGERVYIELAYEEGQEKDFQRFVNTLFLAIDLVFAALPGAGGGGLAVRASHKAAVLAWEVIPESAKLTVAEEVAKTMGWSIAKATQMVNRYFQESKASETAPAKGKGEKGPGLAPPSGKTSTEKYLEKRWDKGTFPTVEKSIEYHVEKHGKGLSAVEYTQRAEKAFNDAATIKTKTTDIQGRGAIKVESKKFGTGLFTHHGRIIWFHPIL